MACYFPQEVRFNVATKGATNLPATTQTAYFTVAGGRVAIKIFGEVTTVIQTQDCDLDIWSNPTVGADVALCAVNNINADAVGTMYNITGTLADALVATTSGAMKDQADWVVVAAGTIDLKTSATNTGATKWVVLWYPIDAGATVTAA